MNLLGRILRDPFHIGVPLRFNKTWRASHLLIHANVVSKQSLTSTVSIYNAFGLHTVNFRMTFSFIIPSARDASPQNFIPSSVIWTRTDDPLDLATYLSWSISFILISCPLLHISVVFYTDGLWSIFLLMVMFFFLAGGKITYVGFLELTRI